MRIEGAVPSPAMQSSRSVSLNSEHGKAGAEQTAGQTQGYGQKKVSEEELIGAIEKGNKKLELYDTRLEFSIHETTKQILIKVVDTVNNEVIREIPPEKILDMVAKMMEMAGILVDERA
jgi:flagellar protein FlaG